MQDDTIFALASGGGRAAIAVLRISGPETHGAVAALCGGRVPAPRQAAVRKLRRPGGAVLDQAMVLWLPGPASYTGEDSAELHLHGGRAVIEGVAAALTAEGLRPAEPGEFTRRAFLNGRMDLVEAEAVHDLVAAETEAQRIQALRQLEGALGDLYRGWSDTLRRMLAQQEALIDFPDEDLPPEVESAMLEALAGMRTGIAAHLDDDGRGEKLREGLCFAISGAPNVGKSSLINALAERDVAIVSEIPGTTRDALETRIVLAGVPVTLVDTAGLRDTADPIEAEGVRRARTRAADADLVIELVEVGAPRPDEADLRSRGMRPAEHGARRSAKAGEPRPADDGEERPTDEGERRAGESCARRPAVDGERRTAEHGEGRPNPVHPPRSGRRLLVANKADLGGAGPEGALRISVLTGEGMPQLRDRLGAETRALTEHAGPPPLTRARHRAALLAARDHLDAAEIAGLPELRAEDLRQAMNALGRITGRIGVEDILDTLFSQFCIGK